MKNKAQVSERFRDFDANLTTRPWIVIGMGIRKFTQLLSIRTWTGYGIWALITLVYLLTLFRFILLADAEDYPCIEYDEGIQRCLPLDFYGDFDSLRDAFTAFVSNIPFYGFATLCIDDPEVQALVSLLSDRRIITYGFSRQSDIRGINLKPLPDGISFDVEIANRGERTARIINNLNLPMYGSHNAQNALAAIALAIEMGVDDESIRQGLAGFAGVNRRFTKVGEVSGIKIIDDYGHHPVEISAVLDAARSSSSGNVIAVFQPHRFSRVLSLFEDFCTCFNDADTVFISDIYAAGEEEIEGVNREALVVGLRDHGHRDVRSIINPDSLAELIANVAKTNDIVICLGAGNITNWAQSLPGELNSIIKSDSGKLT